ncbi:trichohyalin-like [Saccostrea echinata]|uniref:trichohyalin-like n=1 Tax=Saccostrea echinata TaxID=191078 RepID=UPI002A7F54CA|nr:trichohyalin-like [Saccostrea echinata]
MSAAMVDRNPEYPSADYSRSMYDSRPQNDYGRPSYDYSRPTYDSYQQPGDYNRSSYDPPRAQERYDQPSQYQRAPDPPVITSGIVSLSDEKAKERKHLIQMEMRKEYEDHIRRQKPVYYTTGAPEQGLPIGNYGQTRKVLNDERHRDYNKFIKEKEEQVNRHRDEVLQQRQASPPRQPQTEMYDHNQMSQTLREERRKEYNDYLKQKEILEHENAHRPVTPPGGLAIGGYDVYRNQLKADRVREYRESLLKQQNEQWLQRAKEFELDTSPSHEGHLDSERPLVGSPRNVIIDYKKLKEELKAERKNDYNRLLEQKEVNGTPRAPPTPPVGLNIPTEAERHRIAELKKKQYREELLRQQKEQILNRAQHQLEIPVIDRRQAISDPPPPLDLSQDRPPSGRWDPDSYRQPNFGAVKRVTSPPHQANIGHDDYGSYRRQTEHEVRNKEYNEFLAKKQNLEDERRQKLVEQRRQAPAPIIKGDYYSSEQYDHKRQALRDQQHREYQNYLKSDDLLNPMWKGNITSLPMVESELRYNEFRKMQEKQRNRDYNFHLKHEQQSKRAPTPDYLQGLPLSQRQYDNMRKMQEKQRNQEYNQLLAKKGFDRHQPPETNRRPELGMRSEFQDQFQDPLANRSTHSSEMEQYMSRVDNQARFNLNSHIQIAPQAVSSDYARTHSGKLQSYGLMTETHDQFRSPTIKRQEMLDQQEPAGRQSQRNVPLGSLITGDRVDYPSSANVKFNNERRREYNEYIKPQDLKNIHRKREEAISKIESEGIDLDKVRIFPQGEYQDKHKQLQEEWRKNFRDFAAKKHEIVKKELEEREQELAKYYRKEIDNPHILPVGEYKDKQKLFQQQWREECRDYYSGHPVVQKSKEIWKEDEPVHTIPQSGEYKGRRERLNNALREEFKEYLSQKTPPKERLKVFGQQGAVLFDPLYNKDTKNRVREERSKDFQDFLEKQEAERYRKQDNTRSENRIGFMSQLGKPVEEIRERLAKERHEDYNKYLQSKYNSQSQQRPLERPKWVDPKIMEDNWQKEAGGSRSNSRPPSNKPVQTPTYEEMLQRKRREEASYRRYDDPEYSRSGDPGRRPMP